MILELLSVITVALTQSDPVWVQTSYSYASSAIVHAPWALANIGATGITYSAAAGTVPSPPSGLANPYSNLSSWAYPQKITGDSPTPSPTWNSNFGQISTAFVYQTWSVPGSTVPAYTTRPCNVKWTHKNGSQEFEQQVNGAFNGTTARRALDWWVPLGVVIEDSPSQGGDPGTGP